MVCNGSKCGRDIPEDAIFCPYCGKRQVREQKKRKKRANGTGTVYKLTGRRDKPWAAKKNGIHIGTFKSYSDAQKALERLTDAEVNDKYNLTFAQVYEMFKKEKAAKVSKNQMGCYAAAYKSAESLQGRKMRSLRKSDYQKVIDQLQDAGKSLSTVQKQKQLFTAMNRAALDEGIVTRNWAENIEITAQQLTVKGVFTEEQVAAIRASTLPAAQLALIMLGTGCRPADLFAARVEDCKEDFFVSGSKTAAGRNRIIVVSEPGREAYRALLAKAQADGCDMLVGAYAGNKVAKNFQRREFQPLMESIGAPDMTPYCCRHTYVTRAKKAGIDMAVLTNQVGHADEKITNEVYTHLDPAYMINALKALDL